MTSGPRAGRLPARHEVFWLAMGAEINCGCASQSPSPATADARMRTRTDLPDPAAWRGQEPSRAFRFPACQLARILMTSGGPAGILLFSGDPLTKAGVCIPGKAP
jgi:hypothetical protein